MSTTFPGNVTVSQAYNARGYLAEVSRGGTVLEAYQNVDAFGQVTQQSLHNGNMTTWRTTDPDSGRLTAIETQKNAGSERIQHLVMQWRSDGALYRRTDLQGPGGSNDTIETFTYDALNRVTQAVTTLGGGGTLRSLGFGYDTHGNLTGKTSTVSGDAEVKDYDYASSGQPHRLTSATIAGVATSFHYDDNGNIFRYATPPGTDDTWLDYNTRNQVTRITVGVEAGMSDPTARDEFWYGPDGARFLKRETWTEDSTQQQSLTVYLYGGVYEEVHPISDGDTDWHRKIQATSAALIRVTKPAGQSTTETIEYLHRDHLGSVHKVTDAQGNILHDLAFDPFGGRRESDWSSDIETATLEAILDALAQNTGRGFTDHEHLDRTGFIHMNGRVYDPRIGRFVQPDPLVPDPTFSQDYNRYAYVRGQPLSLTDPSGFCAVRAVEVCGVEEPGFGGANGFSILFTKGFGLPVAAHPPSPTYSQKSWQGESAGWRPEREVHRGEEPTVEGPDPTPGERPDAVGGINEFNARLARAYDAFPGRCEACHPSEADLGPRPDVERLNRMLLGGARIGAGVVQIGVFAVSCTTVALCVVASPLLISGISDVTAGVTGGGLVELVLDDAGVPLDVAISFIGVGGMIRGPLMAVGVGRSAFPDIYVGVVSIYSSAEGAGRVREQRQSGEAER